MIKPVDDESEFRRISELVKQNDGYCPCLIEKKSGHKMSLQGIQRTETFGKMPMWKIH